MTKKKIEWDKLNTSIEASDNYKKALDEYNDIDNKVSNLTRELELLKVSKKDKPEVPKELEQFGILSAICLNPDANWECEPETREANIIDVTEDTLKVKVYYGYDRYSYKIINVPCNILIEQGYYFDDKNCYIICDYVDSYDGFKFIMDAILKVEKLQKTKQLAFQKEELAKHQEQIKKLEKDLELYDNIPESKVVKIINKVGFATHWSYDKDTTEFLNNLPRVYKI